MPWEDCYFAHTSDNRFTNTNCNRWYGIKDEETRTFASKGMTLPKKTEVGGAGLGYGIRPYFYNDYHTMLKASNDDLIFQSEARYDLGEQPYANKYYQDMKYQKPVPELLSQTSPELDIQRPTFEIPDIPSPAFPDKGRPMWVHGYICITDVSRLKVCAKNNKDAEGIEIYDLRTHRFAKEALIESCGLFGLYIFNVVQIRQTSPYIYFFIFDSSINDWRAPTSTESVRLNAAMPAIPSFEIWGRTSCPGWNVVLDNTYWQPFGSGFGDWDGSKWTADFYDGPGANDYYRIVLTEIGTWSEPLGQTIDKLRLTFSATYLDYAIFSSDDVTLASGSYYGGNPLESGDEITLSWGASSGYLDRILTNTQTTPNRLVTYNISNIEIHY